MFPYFPFDSLSFHYRGMSEAKEKIKNGKDVPRRFSKEDGGWERLLIDLAATNPSFKGKREGEREGEKTAELEITLWPVICACTCIYCSQVQCLINFS